MNTRYSENNNGAGGSHSREVGATLDINSNDSILLGIYERQNTDAFPFSLYWAEPICPVTIYIFLWLSRLSSKSIYLLMITFLSLPAAAPDCNFIYIMIMLRHNINMQKNIPMSFEFRPISFFSCLSESSFWLVVVSLHVSLLWDTVVWFQLNRRCFFFTWS